MRVEVRALQPVAVDELLLTELRQLGVSQGSRQTRLGEVRPHVQTQHRAEELTQWKNVTPGRCPRCQEVLHGVVESVWTWQCLPCSTSSHRSGCIIHTRTQSIRVRIV